MKKYIFFFTASFFAISIWAQSPGTDQRENFRQREPVSVSGTLVLANGFIALESGDTLYYTGGLERLVGFVDGLKENAQVRLEGYDFNRANILKTQGTTQTETAHFLRVTKLEINGRSYDLGRIAGRDFPGQGRKDFRGGFGPMHGRGPVFGRHGFGRHGGFNGPGYGRRGSGGPGPGKHRRTR
jgi:hypothetical protein